MVQGCEMMAVSAGNCHAAHRPLGALERLHQVGSSSASTNIHVGTGRTLPLYFLPISEKVSLNNQLFLYTVVEI